MNVLPMGVGPFTFRYQGNGAELPPLPIYWYQSRETIDCATTLPLTVRGSVELSLMARWKAYVDFLLTATELLFLSLTIDTL